MKHSLYIILALAIMLLMGACSSTEYADRLDAAERVVDEHPDSALLLLQDLRVDSLTAQQDFARHALVWNLAQYKLFRDDSLDLHAVDSAAAYFVERNDKPHAALSLFLLGKIQTAQNDLGAATHSLCHALDLAVDIRNPYYEALVSQALFHLFAEIYDAPRQVQYAERAYECFKLAGREDWTGYAKLDLAKAYCSNEQYDKAIETAMELQKEAENVRDKILEVHAIQTVALSAYASDKNELSMSYYVKALRKDSTILNENDWHHIQTMLEYHKVKEIPAEDLEIIHRAKVKDNPSQAFLVLARQKNYEAAYRALEVYRAKQDSIVRNMATQHVSESMQDYQTDKNRALSARIRMVRIIWLTVSVGILFCVLLIGIWLRYRYKLQQYKWDRLMFQAQELSQSVIFHRQQNLLLNENIRELFGQRFAVMNRLCASYCENKNKKVVEEVETMMNEFTKNAEIWQELENYVNHHTDGLMEKFRADFPKLKDIDYRIFLYNMLGLSNTAISLFCEEDNVNIIYNRKRHLKDRIKKLSTEKMELYMKYFV